MAHYEAVLLASISYLSHVDNGRRANEAGMYVHFTIATLPSSVGLPERIRDCRKMRKEFGVLPIYNDTDDLEMRSKLLGD